MMLRTAVLRGMRSNLTEGRECLSARLFSACTCISEMVAGTSGSKGQRSMSRRFAEPWPEMSTPSSDSLEMLFREMPVCHMP